jgi:hypothetical protein
VILDVEQPAITSLGWSGKSNGQTVIAVTIFDWNARRCDFGNGHAFSVVRGCEIEPELGESVGEKPEIGSGLAGDFVVCVAQREAENVVKGVYGELSRVGVSEADDPQEKQNR